MIRSLLLTHGAASGPSVFAGWAEAFPGLDVVAVDLQAGLDARRASMSNYAAVLYRTAELLPGPRALAGWSMGGLVAMMASRRAQASKLVLLEPSPPAEIQGVHEEVVVEEGLYDGADAYGAFPDGVVARPESALARAERKRGITVPRLPCPALVVYGDEFAEERGRRIAALYGAERHHLPGLDHWGVVGSPETREVVGSFLAAPAT